MSEKPTWSNLYPLKHHTSKQMAEAIRQKEKTKQVNNVFFK
jgi:hypothetical protein